MAAPQNFRSAFNGFNREDVVHYLEYLNNKHQSQVNQLTAELEELRTQLAQQAAADQQALVTSLQEQCATLTAQLEESEAARAALEERCAALESKPEPVEAPSTELDSYRKAQGIEREAQERAELVYFQASGVLTEATAKVDGIAAEITDMADQVMRQLTQLQVAVSGSKHTLQDAASIMKAIRPN